MCFQPRCCFRILRAFYGTQGSDQAKDLINDADGAIEEEHDFGPGANALVMHGEISATAGGWQYLSILRFLPGQIVIHVGDTVEWMNRDPTEPHTVTFRAPKLHACERHYRPRRVAPVLDQ